MIQNGVTFKHPVRDGSLHGESTSPSSGYRFQHLQKSIGFLTLKYFWFKMFPNFYKRKVFKIQNFFERELTSALGWWL